MKKSFFGCFSLLPVALFAIPALTGCSAGGDDGERIVLRVLNSADYIYEEDDPDAYDEECYYNVYLAKGGEEGLDEDYNIVTPNPDMMDQFVDYMMEMYGVEVDYVYDTFDTNETMFNQIKLGKSSYDIVCPSDYMIQKLASNNLIMDLGPYMTDCGDEDPTLDLDNPAGNSTNIRSNISSYLYGLFDNIYPKDPDDDNKRLEKAISNYTVPYMWGTVGITYNPEFYVDAEDEEALANFVEFMKSWDSLYSEDLTNTFSVKDSVRDVYAMSVIHAYKDEIAELREKESDDAVFNEKLTEIFNRCDDDTLALVKEDMLALKANSFGFEVDSGKTDMVSGKIGANLAWSGDATWAIMQAESDFEKELYFSIPNEGSNIWCDGWCVPTTSKHPEIAVKFMEFMSRPESAVQNMWYVGYTSATAGEIMLDYVYECYDARCYVDADILDEETIEYIDSLDGFTYDLSYFFADLDDPTLAEIIPAEGVIDRTLTAQYPSKDMLPNLCVMDDFGRQNEAVLDMWESVRTNSLPVWAIVILVLEFLAAMSVIIYFIIQKGTKKNLKKARRVARQAN